MHLKLSAVVGKLQLFLRMTQFVSSSSGAVQSGALTSASARRSPMYANRYGIACLV
jgi:hypothetical protein